MFPLFSKRMRIEVQKKNTIGRTNTEIPAIFVLVFEQKLLMIDR